MNVSMPGRKIVTLFSLAIFAVCMLHTATLALQTSDPADTYAGTWQGKFQGKVFVTLTLQKQAGALTGTISHTTVQLDNNGELTGATQDAGSDPITDVKLDSDALHFASEDTASQDTTQYEMKLSGADEAQLQIVAVPSGTPAPKPWKLARLAATTADTAQTPTIKSKLSAAARIWMQGQFGASTQPTGAGTTGIASSPGNAATSAGTAPADANATEAVPALKVSDTPLDANLQKDIDGLPRRIQDEFRNPGDMVNIVIVGSQEQVLGALDAATWHVADTDNRGAVLNAVLQTYQKKDYLQMPMSKLYLFDRVQDYGFEEAEPYAMVASRNHFRLWKAPFTWNGQTVWVGAGTHDIGFEKDQRNGKVTHKIDPAIDGERDNIGATLQNAGKATSVSYYLPPDPVKEAKNATGGGYHSDGRILVVEIQ
jgi:LssY C-terminus